MTIQNVFQKRKLCQSLPTSSHRIVLCVCDVSQTRASVLTEQEPEKVPVLLAEKGGAQKVPFHLAPVQQEA